MVMRDGHSCNMLFTALLKLQHNTYNMCVLEALKKVYVTCYYSCEWKISFSYLRLLWLHKVKSWKNGENWWNKK
jgi:hypothetical protein